MSGNSFGTIFKITTFGESHGSGLGVIIDGIPAGLAVDQDFLRIELARRRPGQSVVATSRQEEDEAEILSGVYQNRTLGTPVAVLIRNHDCHSKDYAQLMEVYRPGHADYGWDRKFGYRDVRGGGRSSGRETVARVVAGAFAKMFLRTLNVNIQGYAKEIGGITARKFEPDTIENNIVRCADPQAVPLMIEAIMNAKTRGDSTGGVVGCKITGVPAGWGEPVFDKLDACLAHAMLSIGGVKGIEFGNGFEASRLNGSGNNDAPTPNGWSTNRCGGIIGGISTGAEINFCIAIKPTPSISLEQNTINCHNQPVSLRIPGRHDPCIVPRIIPVVEAMTAIVLADAALINNNAKL